MKIIKKILKNNIYYIINLKKKSYFTLKINVIVMNKKILAFVAIFLLVIGGITLYFTMRPSDDTIIIGHLASDHDAAIYVAEAQKQYEAQGLKVETVQFNNGGDLITAMASGDVKVGYVGITPLLSAIENGVPVKIVSGTQLGGSGIVVRSDSNITSLKDLKGKKVATPGAATIQNMILTYGLNQSGVNTKDVEIISMKAAQMKDALNAGQIDAMICWEPYASIAVEKGNGKLLENTTQIIPNHPCCVVVAREDFIKNHPKELKKILAIHENATKFANENPKEAAKALPEDIVPDKNLQTDIISDTQYIYGLDDDYKQSVIDFMQLGVDLGLYKETADENEIFAEV